MNVRFLAFAISLLCSTSVFAETPKVVVSVKPIHSLVASILGETAEPLLLIDGGASPHTFSLKPSHASALNQAALVFWVGPDLESVLINPMDNLVQEGSSVPLIHADGVSLLEAREGGIWGDHAHHDEHEEDTEEEHSFDPHIWLDIQNAIAITKTIERRLSQTYPELAPSFSENANTLRTQLNVLDQELREQLAPVSETPYYVFHDAYQYFEKSYSLSPLGAVTVNPEVKPGARRLTEMKEAGDGVVCVFAEPQFEPRILRILMEDEGTKLGYLDPLGSELQSSPGHYAATLRALATSLTDCLATETNSQ
jgi:zinc transport system substrate-binding protein